MNPGKGIILVTSPRDGGQLALVSSKLAGKFNVSPESFAAEVRKAAPTLLAAAAPLHKDETTKATRFKTGDIEFMLMQALVPFDDGRPFGIICAVLPREQREAERAIAKVRSEIHKHLEGVS